MHVLEAAHIANFFGQKRSKGEAYEPMPRPRRSHAANIALAAVAALGIIVIMLGIAVAGPTRIVATAGVEATEG